MTTMSEIASGVFSLVDGRKNTTKHKLHSVILGTSIEVGCSNQLQMQLAQGHHLNADLALSLCFLHLVAASHSYTCAQDDTVQLALVVFVLPSPSEFENTPLALMVFITCCMQLALVVLFLEALVHLLMCTQVNRHTLQLALCTWWRW